MRRYITIGFTALLLLLPLALTSTNRMMRRLGRRWQKLHRLVYLIAVLGVWHYYWEVKADVRKPLMYAAILAVLFALRWWQARSRRAPVVRRTMSPAALPPVASAPARLMIATPVTASAAAKSVRRPGVSARDSQPMTRTQIGEVLTRITLLLTDV